MSQHSIQISYGELPPLRLDDLTPQEYAWLMSLRSPYGLSSSEPQGRGPTPSTSITLIAQKLITCGFASADTSRPRTHGITKEYASESLALRASALRSGPILSARARATVAVKGVTPISLELMRTLALSGVRNFIIDDPRSANSVEFSALTLFPDHATTRSAAALHYLNHLAPEARAVSFTQVPTVAVVSCTTKTDELEAASLAVCSVATLELWNRESYPVIGPFTIPEVTPCLTCQNGAASLSNALVRDSRASWEFESTTLHQDYFVPISATRASVIGALAAQEVLQYIDGQLPSTAHSIISLTDQSLAWESLDHSTQESCLCALSVDS